MKTMLLHLTIAAGLAAAGVAAAADITIYEHDNYEGRHVQTRSPLPDLVKSNFNDRASSVVIREGQWEICVDADFRGRCVTLGPGSYPSLSPMGLNDAISSVREVGGRGGRGRGGAGNPTVVLFEGYELSGVSILADRTVDNLDGTGFNDRARSMLVTDGPWELCVDADFRGGCQVFAPGRYDDLGALRGRVSSLRPVAGGPAGGGRSHDRDWGRGNRVVLYSGANLTGRSLFVDGYFANLDGAGFNDHASSLRVERGYWIFCSDAVFQGECRTFGPGDYPVLPPGLDNRISSGRRISNDYPYGSTPNWGRPR